MTAIAVVLTTLVPTVKALLQKRLQTKSNHALDQLLSRAVYAQDQQSLPKDADLLQPGQFHNQTEAQENGAGYHLSLQVID